MSLALLAASAFVLAAERVSYIWISQQPAAFVHLADRARLGRRGPVYALRTLFVWFKVLQIATFGVWCAVHGTWPAALVSPVAAALGGSLLVVGQLLNARVFWLLGTDGVFYGKHFGLPVPWRVEFPFSWMAHPQYLGTCLSIWGFFLVARYPHSDWIALPMLETAYYVAGACLER